MRFDDFLVCLEKDAKESGIVRLEKTKDIQGRVLVYIKNRNKVLAEVGYKDNGTRSVRSVKVFDETGVTEDSTSGVRMARRLLTVLNPYVNMRNSEPLVN